MCDITPTKKTTNNNNGVDENTIKNINTPTSIASSNEQYLNRIWEAAETCELNRSVLSDRAILAHMQLGNVIITPFTLNNLSTSSYDVTLGRYYYRESDY